MDDKKLYDPTLSTHEWIRERNKLLKEKQDKIDEIDRQERTVKALEKIADKSVSNRYENKSATSIDIINNPMLFIYPFWLF